MDLKETLEDISSLRYFFLRESATVVIPCLNEEATIGKVVDECKSSMLVNEVIVVDDGSTDGTAAVAKRHGAKVVRHRKNRGKGAAIVTGAKAASNSTLVFVDGDIMNFSSSVVEKLALPVIKGEARMCKSSYFPLEGRITDFTAKPLLRHMFSDVDLGQPLSGQFAIRRELLLGLDITNDWGVDIAIVLLAIKAGEKIVEVNIGQLEHKHRDHASKIRTADEVSRTILQQAGFLACRHRLIIFDFDGVLVAGRSIDFIAGKLGFLRPLQAWRENFRRGRMTERQLSGMIAAKLEGIGVDRFRKIAFGARKSRFAEETITYLRRMGYKIAVVSYAYDRIIQSVFKPHLFDIMICPRLKIAKNRIGGGIVIPKFPGGARMFNKGKACRCILKRLGIKPSQAIAIGDSESDADMFRSVGTSACMGRKKIGGADYWIKSLPEVLIIAN